MRSLVLALACVLLAAGCVSNPTTEDRLACLKLSAEPYATVPKCSTQEECFSQITKTFGSEEDVLGHDLSRELFSAKNHLARSWFFFNLARKNLGSINTECGSANFSAIPQKINELNSNLSEVGRETDLFNEGAITSIALEKTQLESEKISKAQQEPLYDIYILLSQNVVDFAQKNPGGNTFASIFLREHEKLSQFSQALGLEPSEPEVFVSGIISSHKTVTNAALRAFDFKLGLLFPIFTETASFIESGLKLKTAAASLANVPQTQFFGAINSIIGLENSAASEFLEMFANDVQERKALFARNNLRIENATANLASATQILGAAGELSDEDAKEIFYYDSNGVSFVFTDFAQNGIEGDIAQMQKSIFDAKSGAISGTTLGEYTSLAFLLETQSGNILVRAKAQAKNVSDAKFACEGKIKEISEKLASAYNGVSDSIIYEKALLAAKISAYNETHATAQCAQILRGFSSFNSLYAQKNAEDDLRSRFAACISKAELAISDNNFSDLNAQLLSLKINSSSANPAILLDACNSILSRAEKFSDARAIVSLQSAQTLAALGSISADMNSFASRYAAAMPSADLNQGTAQMLAARKSALDFELGILGDQEQQNAKLLSEKIGLLIEVGKYAEADSQLDSLGTKISTATLALSGKVDVNSQAEQLRDKIATFIEKHDSLSKSTGVLQKEFDSLRPEELAEIYYLMPITQEALAQISKLRDTRPMADQILALLDSGQNDAAIAAARKADFDSKFDVVSKADAQAALAVQKFKESAVAAYNSAVAKQKAAGGSEQSDSDLAGAKKNISEGDYAPALLASQRITGMLLSGSAAQEIPYAAYILAAAVVLCAGYIALRKNKKEEDDMPQLPDLEEK